MDGKRAIGWRHSKHSDLGTCKMFWEKKVFFLEADNLARASGPTWRLCLVVKTGRIFSTYPMMSFGYGI